MNYYQISTDDCKALLLAVDNLSFLLKEYFDLTNLYFIQELKYRIAQEQMLIKHLTTRFKATAIPDENHYYFEPGAYSGFLGAINQSNFTAQNFEQSITAMAQPLNKLVLTKNYYMIDTIDTKFEKLWDTIKNDESNIKYINANINSQRRNYPRFGESAIIYSADLISHKKDCQNKLVENYKEVLDYLSGEKYDNCITLDQIKLNRKNYFAKLNICKISLKIYSHEPVTMASGYEYNEIPSVKIYDDFAFLTKPAQDSKNIPHIKTLGFTIKPVPGTHKKSMNSNYSNLFPDKSKNADINDELTKRPSL